MSEYIFFNFYSIGTTIVAVTGLLCGIFLLSIPDKSESTRALGMGFLLTGLFDSAYILAQMIYHPMAAYHRWLTVALILPSLAYFAQFCLKFPRNDHPRLASRLLSGQLILGGIVTAVFIYFSLQSPRIYHFDGHYWDFNAEKLSSIVGMFILLYLLIFIAAGLWKFFVVKTRERYALLTITFGLILGGGVPIITYVLSRNGTIDRGVHMTVFVIFVVVGFFLMFVIYVNYTRDKTTFMAKIVGITLVTMMLLMQGVSYITTNEMERYYDALNMEKVKRSMHSDFFSKDILYVSRIDLKSKEPARIVHKNRAFGLDARGLSGELEKERSRLNSFPPAHREGARFYRRGLEKNFFFIAYRTRDPGGKFIQETGFSYRQYREFAHPSATKLKIFLIVMFATIMFFPVFFRGSLSAPLKNLLGGVETVNKGDLNTVIPVYARDEIGFLSESFNAMVKSIRHSQEEQIRLLESFSRFVPGQFLKYLGHKSIVDVGLGDAVEKDMTVLFCDIRNFTSLSEAMSVEDNFRFLNSYLKRMGPIIHDNNGFVDKFIGDAIMALFSERPDDALNAAVSMMRKLRRYNRQRRKLGLIELRAGIGINTGLLMLGTVGSRRRLDTTVIGDTVNLGQRMESLTKIFKSPVLLTGAVKERLENPDEFRLRLVDQVRVKGRSVPVDIFELIDADNSKLADKKEETLEAYNQGRDLYVAGEFSEAMKKFDLCLEIAPEDPLPAVYRRRCVALLEAPPGKNWAGISRVRG